MKISIKKSKIITTNWFQSPQKGDDNFPEGMSDITVYVAGLLKCKPEYVYFLSNAINEEMELAEMDMLFEYEKEHNYELGDKYFTIEGDDDFETFSMIEIKGLKFVKSISSDGAVITYHKAINL